MTSPDVVSAAVPSAPKCTYTRSPSRMGVGSASEFLGLSGSTERTWKTSVLMASRPVAISYAMARNDPPFRSLTAVVSHTRPLATAGDDQPIPGTGVFQRTFRDSLHSNG